MKKHKLVSEQKILRINTSCSTKEAVLISLTNIKPWPDSVCLFSASKHVYDEYQHAVNEESFDQPRFEHHSRVQGEQLV